MRGITEEFFFGSETEEERVGRVFGAEGNVNGENVMAKKKKSSKTRKSSKAKKAGKPPKGAALVSAGQEKRHSGLDAAARVLKEAGKPMKVKAVVETMLAKGYWQTGGKTPWATMYSAITREIGLKKGESRFKKTGRGTFASTG